jgi:hypothetical protein
MIGAFSGLRPTEMYNLTWGGDGLHERTRTVHDGVHQPAEADLLQVGELMRLEAGYWMTTRGAIARCCTRT